VAATRESAGLTTFPWYPWYPSDFLASTRGWPLTATGGYRSLLDCQWDRGALPESERELRALIGATAAEWRITWRFVESKFPVDDDGKRRNARLERHRRRAVELHEDRRRVSALGNAARWGVAHTDAHGSQTDPGGNPGGIPSTVTTTITI
jgi:uncharacterized protein YdaU (DUF1376 family)